MISAMALSGGALSTPAHHFIRGPLCIADRRKLVWLCVAGGYLRIDGNYFGFALREDICGSMEIISDLRCKNIPVSATNIRFPHCDS
jgi:hypothetical protein